MSAKLNIKLQNAGLAASLDLAKKRSGPILATPECGLNLFAIDNLLTHHKPDHSMESNNMTWADTDVVVVVVERTD